MRYSDGHKSVRRVAYVFILLMPWYGNYQIIGAEPQKSFRQCMLLAQQHNDKHAGKSFAVCMPTIHENLTHTLPRKTRRHASR